MKTDGSMVGTMLELRELLKRLPKMVQTEVMTMEKVQDVWAWLEKEYGGRVEQNFEDRSR